LVPTGRPVGTGLGLAAQFNLSLDYFFPDTIGNRCFPDDEVTAFRLPHKAPSGEAPSCIKIEAYQRLGVVRGGEQTAPAKRAPSSLLARFHSLQLENCFR
jgi:hypothetical protein